MAEESAQAEGAEAPEEKKGGGKKIIVLAGGLVLLLAIGGGAAWYLGLVGGGTDHAEAKEAAEGGEHGAAAEDGHGGGSVPGVGALLALEPFIANLNDEDGRRYLKATLQVEFFKSAVPGDFNVRLPQVRDLLLTLLSSKTFAEVRTPQGKAVLRDEIVTRLNHALRQDYVKAVYFTEFVVQ